MPIVLNEWVFHDLAGDNGPAPQVECAIFLERLQASDERIAVLRGGPWALKMYRLIKINSASVQILSKLLHRAILQDSRKCFYVSQEEIRPLPPELAALVPIDDIYLFQTAIASGSNTIVTCDQRLAERVSDASARQGIEVRMREEFLRTFANANVAVVG